MLFSDRENKSFSEKSITVYQDMFDFFVIPQLHDIPNILFQLDRASPHWS